MSSFCIAIDGDSASGKGTLARLLAAKYNTEYLPTGNLYRVLAKLVLESHIKIDDHDGVCNQLQYVADQDLFDSSLVSNNIAQTASQIATIPKVRAYLNEYQKTWAANHKIAILEGRDIGTKILPDANVKIYLTANLAARAKRRYLDLHATLSLEDITAELDMRDKRDKNREQAPLTIAQDAHVIDSSNMSSAEVFKRVEEIIYLGCHR